MSEIISGEDTEIQSKTGLSIENYFSKSADADPLDDVKFKKTRSVISEPDGTVVFEMNDVEVPEDWSQLSTDIVVSKYFRKAGVPGTGHEVSVKKVISRIIDTISDFGFEHNYFATKSDAKTFRNELAYLLIHRIGAFNSPVWFNVGLYHKHGIKGSGGNFAWDFKEKAIKAVKNSYERPQGSACFIQSVKDDLMSIFELAKNEAQLFKYGSGTGTNFSAIRGRQEKLSGGGTSSGLMSFLEVLDKGAGATKSGGTTRRAAKMVCLDMDHPEIVDFITWKMREEKKVAALIKAGYSADFNDEAYRTVSGQNSNNSVRITDEFMDIYFNHGEWKTRLRTTGEEYETYEARELMHLIAESAWHSAEPGVQFDSTINKWHTCKGTDRINSSNPCSEFMFLDNSACNLASLNLVKFLHEDGTFDVESYRKAVRIFIIAQEILVDLASYPTGQIAGNSHNFRPLGLGYANLGTLLMMKGFPYDSAQGRAYAATLTAIMTGHAYKTSAEIASKTGPFAGFPENRNSMLNVMRMHQAALGNIHKNDLLEPRLLEAAEDDWQDAIDFGEEFGYRNAQVTLLAPTGTIGLLMDCDTTGVEPDFALVKWKKLAGGGYFKIINQSIPKTLRNLGYIPEAVEDIVNYALGYGTLQGAPHLSMSKLIQLGFREDQIKEAEAYIGEFKVFDNHTPHITPIELQNRGFSAEQVKKIQIFVGGAQTVEGAPHLKPEHYAIFDCANRCGIGSRFIEPMGHVKMMAAVQPFLSGAISKTINLPNEATIEEVEQLYVQAWKLGIKAVALYRDGSKLSQPLSNQSDEQPEKEEKHFLRRGQKRHLPARRPGITIGADVAGNKVYLRTGDYEDGKLGEIFVDMFKAGASYRSLLNCFAVAVSMGLQYGVPLEKYVEKFVFTRFDPAGMVNHPNVKTCTSVLDYVFRVLGMEYLGRTDFLHVKPNVEGDEANMEDEESNETIPLEIILPEQAATEVKVKGNGHSKSTAPDDAVSNSLSDLMGDAPTCDICGHITVRNGSCYKCLNCGNSLGCS
ncbi:MAG TPA: vitamin B12-dependent ribonucleotide reductase [Bacteroidetes bacterium]|nr:vitamin B12-dependent ribonucleotide reductase [Bacteroidota bacterium]